MRADVLAPDFQFTENSCQTPVVEGGLDIPMTVLLILNCSCAGELGLQEEIQAEKS
jgi:hypothetical protein